MKPGSKKYTDVPLQIVGSTKFGRYPKISSEQTFNMIISDDWLVPFAGYKSVAEIIKDGSGRTTYTSFKLGYLFVVVDNTVFKFDSGLNKTFVGTLETYLGNVFIAENNAGQVLFSDLQKLYVYDSVANTFTQPTPPTVTFLPGYITFQNGRFVVPDTTSNLWYLSDLNAATFPNDPQHVGSLQTKPDFAVAAIRFPGRGNLLYVFGKTVTEPWNDVGNSLFPYNRNSTLNIDYGCLSAATIAESDSIVCWLGSNEKSGPVIMYSNGGDIKVISNDGINFVLADLVNPSNSYAFMFKQDGHLFYVITFLDDGLTYAWDFTTENFYTLTDEVLNYFVAKRVSFFNDQYYFVSFNDGNLYQLGSQFTNYDYGLDEFGNEQIYTIPRIRIPEHIRQPDQSRFIAGYSGFTIESGITDLDQKVELSLSKDGGVSFGSSVSYILNKTGKRTNRLFFRNLGMSNDLVQQYRFYGFDRFIATNGITGIYQ